MRRAPAFSRPFASLLISVVALAIAFALPIQAQAGATTVVVGSDVGLNLRAEPSFDSSIVDTLSDGASIELVDGSGPVLDPDGETRWWHVRHGGAVGWVVGTYLDIDGGAAARFDTGRAEIRTDDGTGANLRRAPGTDAAIIVGLAEGTPVEVLSGPEYDEQGWPWFSVTDGAVTGYARTDVLSAPGPQTAAPAFTYSAEEVGRVPILMYHRVDYSGDRYSVTPEQLSEQCAWLVENGYTAITLWQFYDAAFNGGPLPAKPVVLTADDGWASAVTFGEILAEYGLVGNYFVNNISQLTADEIVYLSQLGQVAAHTVNHLMMSLLGYNAQLAEIYDNRVYLESVTGVYIPFLAWPFGNWNASAVQAAPNAGIIAAFDAVGGAAYFGAIDPYHIPRIEISVWDDLTAFANKVLYL